MKVFGSVYGIIYRQHGSIICSFIVKLRQRDDEDVSMSNILCEQQSSYRKTKKGYK